jgi:signal transduction histidine kinase
MRVDPWRVRGSRLITGLAAAVAVVAAAGGFALRVEAGIDLGDPFLGLVESGLAATLIALLLLWRRPGHRMGAILASAGLLFGLSALASGVLVSSGSPSVWSELAFGWIWLAQAPLVLVWALTILALPDGQVGGALRRGFLAGASMLAGGLAIAEYLFAGPGRVPEFPPARAPSELAGPLAHLGDWEPLYQLGQGLFPAIPALALVGLIARFRSADPIVRQQLKWVLVAAVLTVLANVLRASLNAAGGDLETAGAVVGLAAEPLPALGIALAVLRYRLWELDLLVSRALVYGLLWAALTAVFMAVALAAGVLAGGADVLIPVALALFVALAGQPLRSRLEQLVRRLVYGDEPAGYAVVARFGETLAEAARAGELAPRIAESARRAVEASWAGVWLRVGSSASAALHPAAVAGADGGASLLLTTEAAAWLRGLRGPVLATEVAPDVRAVLGPGWRLESAALAPLSAGDELVGVLTFGERAGRPLGKPDLELIAMLARQSALALRNVRLETELRSRLEEIEAQAEELRRSRRRLVTAQDTERRRIERDLHDGVQQHLVSLAAKLGRASRAADPTEAQQLLREAAAVAEESVFALQELARGIYPSLLADQGLAAAMRTHANRVPADVRVEVEPALAGRRFGRELEAALYFVALEAMANVQKHAPAASLSVSLRSAGDGRRLVLEVHDDGPGFDPRQTTRGAGLQNMADRLAAVGGTLGVESRPGAGTWIRAEAPLAAPVVPLQRSGDSRR